MPVPSSTTPSQSSHPRVEAVIEEIEGQGPRCDEEHEDPDRPVRQPVSDLVPLSDAAVARQLDPAGVAKLTLIGRWK